MPSISRKEFLRLAAAGLGAVVGGRFIAACGATPTLPPVSPTAAALPLLTETVVPPTPTEAVETLTSTPGPVRRPDVMKIYPAAPSRVVHMHHSGVWQGDTLQPEALKQMLDASVTRLTGLEDALSAWKILFDPSEKVAIKVNTLPFGRFWTHVPLVLALAERLQAAGLLAENIIVYDRTSNDLTRGGFTINKDGPGVRCYGTDYQYGGSWKIGDTNVGLSEILLGCDALIDLPILKTHSMDGAGMSFALKNHYGTFDQPQSFHYDKLLTGLPELNALAPIKEKTRLVLGDALKIVQDGWTAAFDSDFICMSFDPVAHDALGLTVLNEVQAANGLQTEPTRLRAAQWLQNAAALGLGTDQMANIDFVEERLA